MNTEDIRRLNYIYYTSYSKLVKNPPSLLMCYFLFFARAIFCFIFRHHLESPTAPVLIYASTLNNMRAVQPVVDNLKSENVLWGYKSNSIPFSRIYLKSIFNLKLFQKFYSSSPATEKALIRTFYETFMTTTGCYLVMDEILEKNPHVRVILFANDHSVINRCMIELAEKRGIKTVYVQHASVTEKFPPLNFTYSFLDGKDSYNKYHAVGNMRGNVFISGSPRFDVISNFRNKEKIYDVGIAMNMMDDVEKVLNLCRYLAMHYSRKIIVRPHPRMKLNATFFEKEGFEVSYPNGESSFDFLAKVKIMIANESGIHLDAALIEVPSVLYNFSGKEILDWYSFLKNGLMPICHSQEEVLSYLQQPRNINVDVVRYYVASYKTPWDGKVGLMVASLIDHISDGTDAQWVKEHKDILATS